MTLSAIASSLSSSLPAVNFHPHGHRKGAHIDTNGSSSTLSTSSSSGSSGIGLLPVGATTPLFTSVLQSLQRTVGAAASGASSGTTAVGAATSAGGSTAAGGTTALSNAPANIQAFMHSLFQALKQDGLGSSGAAAGSSASSTTAGAAAAGATGTSYQSNLVSSLNTLIQQLSSGSQPTSATATLSAAYQNLVGGSTSAAAASAGANSAANGGLQTFLSNLLQNLQGNGVHALGSVGNSVNANV